MKKSLFYGNSLQGMIEINIIDKYIHVYNLLVFMKLDFHQNTTPLIQR